MEDEKFDDVSLSCVECQQPFVLTAGEQSYFKLKNLNNPRRCKACRQARRQAREGQDQQRG